MSSESEELKECIWICCPICNCFLDSLSSYKLHYLYKHDGTPNDDIDNHPPPPKPSKSITIFLSKVNITKLSHQELGRYGQQIKCKEKKKNRSAPSKRHQCDICSMTFDANARLERHIITWHTKEKPFKCPDCGKGFSRTDSLRSHQRIHSSPNNYTCEHCDKKFRHLSYYYFHMRSKHTKDEDRRKYQCPDCPSHFFTQGKLDTHREKVHNIKKERKFQCNICSKRLISITSFKNHLLMHTAEKHYGCDKCSKTFTQKSNLTTHKKTHERNRPRSISCTKCSKTFLSNQQLQHHIDSVHERVNKFHCPICNKGFSHKQPLESHLGVHVAERHHKCQFCEKSFKHASSLKMHIRLHLGEKPYRCKRCGKGYTQRANLECHVKQLCGKVRNRKKNKSH